MHPEETMHRVGDAAELFRCWCKLLFNFVSTYCLPQQAPGDIVCAWTDPASCVPPSNYQVDKESMRQMSGTTQLWESLEAHGFREAAANSRDIMQRASCLYRKGSRFHGPFYLAPG